jgi:hypothetical protein
MRFKSFDFSNIGYQVLTCFKLLNDLFSTKYGFSYSFVTYILLSVLLKRSDIKWDDEIDAALCLRAVSEVVMFSVCHSAGPTD